MIRYLKLCAHLIPYCLLSLTIASLLRLAILSAALCHDLLELTGGYEETFESLGYRVAGSRLQSLISWRFLYGATWESLLDRASYLMRVISLAVGIWTKPR